MGDAWVPLRGYLVEEKVGLEVTSGEKLASLASFLRPRDHVYKFSFISDSVRECKLVEDPEAALQDVL